MFVVVRVLRSSLFVVCCVLRVARRSWLSLFLVVCCLVFVVVVRQPSFLFVFVDCLLFAACGLLFDGCC